MGPRKTTSDAFYEGGYPGLLQRLCKEEDVLIIPQFVVHLTSRQVESISPRHRGTAQGDSGSHLTQKLKESKDTKLNEKLGSSFAETSTLPSESKGEDLLNCNSLRPPQVGIAYENPEDKDTPIAVICKNIYIEFALISAIGKSLKSYPTISSLKIENCCISREITEALALLLAEDSGRWISDVSLDGNEDIADVIPLFAKLTTGLRYLSLQRCSLEDNDMEAFAEALAYGDGRDQKLQCLNLSMNRIGNLGACFLAEALRTNRSLISISLAGNRIGDEGVACLTEVLQKFPLTYEEVMMRRKRIFDSIFRKKNAVEKYIEEWKAKGEEEINQAKKTTISTTERMGRRIRGPDGKIRCLSGRDLKNKSGTAKTNTGEKFRGRVRSVTGEAPIGIDPTPSEVMEIVQQVESELPPDKHPFVNEVRLTEEGTFCSGCWSLVNINLAYNYLTEESVARFNEVLNFQTANYINKVGILRLVLLPGNLFQENLPEYQKLQTALIYRNTKRDVHESSDLPTGSITSAKRISSGRAKK